MRPSLYLHPHPLRKQCQKFITGKISESSTEHFEHIATFIRHNKAQSDVYGAGGFVEDFEHKMATHLGKEAAIFMPTGAMAQLIACRIWCEQTERNTIAMHPTCQIALNEHDAYAVLHGMKPTFIGEYQRPFDVKDFNELTSEAVFVYELPMRQLGCIAPDYDELLAHLKTIKEKGIKLHLDGARLWEIAPYYDLSPSQVCTLFDSVYVSFYKGLGAFGGALLAGDNAFIEQTKIWRRRHGGDIKTFLPFAVSAAMNFENACAELKKDKDRAIRLAKFINNTRSMATQPTVPQCNTFHIEFDASIESLTQIRDEIAKTNGIWTFDYFFQPFPDMKPRFEYVAGNHLDQFEDQDLEKVLKLFDNVSKRS
ncbi:MAG: low specificity L-threonine aldolase [Rhodospirillales bacterium]|nr:low specificity L-threonine aldolase [Rhodospirillales bacterium]